MKSSPSSIRAALAGLSCVLLASGAQARNDIIMLPVAAAMKQSAAREIARDIPLRFGAETATAAPQDVLRADVTAQGKGSATGENPRRHESPSDETVCIHAFENALAQLAAAAHEAHAGAVVGIVTAYKGGTAIDDGRIFECHAGVAWFHVTLRGQLVKSVPVQAAPSGVEAGE